MNVRHRRHLFAVLSTAASVALVVTAAPAGADLGAPTDTSPRTVTRSPSPTPQLVDVTMGRHAAYDRVVFTFDGDAPGYVVRYVRHVRGEGSGETIPLRGHANLLVRLTPADAHDGQGQATYTGPHRITPGYPQLREVAFAGDFEAVVAFGLGLRHKAGFRVFTLSGPTRIVVDVAH